MKATNEVIRQRVAEIEELRLSCKTLSDIRRYVAQKQEAEEHPWSGDMPADRTLQHYIRRADKLIVEDTEEDRRDMLNRHYRQRRHLLKLALKDNDIRTALAVLDSEAKLRGLFEDEVNRQIEEMWRIIRELQGEGSSRNGGNAPGGSDHSPAEPASLDHAGNGRINGVAG